MKNESAEGLRTKFCMKDWGMSSSVWGKLVSGLGQWDVEDKEGCDGYVLIGLEGRS